MTHHGLLSKVRKVYPSCEGIRFKDGEWQCAIATTMETLHWVWLEVIPLGAAKIIDPVAAVTESPRVASYKLKNEAKGGQAS